MSTIEITSIVQQLQEWETIMEEAKEMVESLKDTIKAEMNSRALTSWTPERTSSVTPLFSPTASTPPPSRRSCRTFTRRIRSRSLPADSLSPDRKTPCVNSRPKHRRKRPRPQPTGEWYPSSITVPLPAVKTESLKIHIFKNERGYHQ